ncbi:hypothetical protein [Dyadobacter sp.]|uniref:hypothetical protein n=1 Tax=Dyadobacter sp. TaxID=1914288 RepID=UPI003F6E4F92
MKTKFFLIIVQLLFFLEAAAPNVKPTSQGNTCQYCMPNGWTNDASAISFSLSNEVNYAGLAGQAWNPAPDGPAPSFLGSFLSAQGLVNAPAITHTILTGLMPNKTYYLRYHVMSSKRLTDAGYGEAATIELATVSNGVATPFTSQTTTFTPGVNTSKWIPKILKFTPSLSNVRLTFTGSSTVGGFVNLDIGFNALTECLAGTEQVSLSTASLEAKCAAGADLTTLVQSAIANNEEVVWFTNPNHTGAKYSDPKLAIPGVYYAFIYHKILECYNTDNSTAQVTVTGSQQVPISTDKVTNTCPFQFVDLNSLFTGSLPNGASLVWFTNDQHLGQPVSDVNTVSSGTYYAFYHYQAQNCFNTDKSTASVTVTINPPVPVKSTSSQIICPKTSINLVTEFFQGLIPQGAELRFFSNATHSGSPISNLNVGAGTYYAFYYYAANNCYNQDLSTAKIEVTYMNCADLSPTVAIGGVSFTPGAQRDFVVNLYEIKGGATTGTISLRITKPGGFTISYPLQSGTSNVPGGAANENSNWAFTENDNFITATSQSVISPNGKAVIGFAIKRKDGISSGVTQNINATILTGSGGDSNSANNTVITSVSTN